MTRDPKWDDLAADAARDSFPAVASWLEHTAVNERTERSSSRKLAYAAGLTLLLGLACAVPVKQTEHLGWLINVTIPGTTEAASAMIATAQITDALVFAKPRAGSAPSTDVTIAGIAIDDDVAQQWLRAINSLPGGTGAELTPLTESVERPAYQAAARAIAGERFAPSLSRAEIERRIAKRLASLGSGSVAVKIDPPEGGSELLVVPATPGAPMQMEADPDEVILMILRRQDSGATDTLWLPLNAAAYQASDQAERTRLIRRALSERRITGVDVTFERGVVVIRVQPGDE